MSHWSAGSWSSEGPGTRSWLIQERVTISSFCFLDLGSRVLHASHWASKIVCTIRVTAVWASFLVSEHLSSLPPGRSLFSTFLSF